MARIAKHSASPASDIQEDIYGATPNPPSRARVNNQVPSPHTSDKENQSAQREKRGASSSMASGLSEQSINAAGKRRRGEESVAPVPRRRRRTVEPEEDADVPSESEGYDPEQDIKERRNLRKQLRNLTKNLNDNRAEYLHAGSTGLIDTLNRANDIAGSVRQTADATIDSRLVVTAAELAYRKTVQLTLGDSALGVDIDEFVSKCCSFMRRNGEAPARAHGQANGRSHGGRSTQVRHNQGITDGSDSERDNDEEGEMLNWESLGRVLVQHNSRPALPGFLLGPLSFTKRARKPIMRKAGLKISSLRQTQPELLTSEDIQRSENTNLTVLCGRILTTLTSCLERCQDAAEAENDAQTGDGLDEREQRQLLDRHGLTASGQIDFFKFVVNPRSFSQTVENMFYVSFLIRDGKVGIEVDDDGMLALEVTKPRERTETVAQGVSKHQAILALDMRDWKRIIQEFDITEPMIPHREEDIVAPLGARGWYS